MMLNVRGCARLSRRASMLTTISLPGQICQLWYPGSGTPASVPRRVVPWQLRAIGTRNMTGWCSPAVQIPWFASGGQRLLDAQGFSVRVMPLTSLFVQFVNLRSVDSIR